MVAARNSTIWASSIDLVNESDFINQIPTLRAKVMVCQVPCVSCISQNAPRRSEPARLLLVSGLLFGLHHTLQGFVFIESKDAKEQSSRLSILRSNIGTKKISYSLAAIISLLAIR